METTVTTSDLSNNLIAESTLATLDEIAPSKGIERIGGSPQTLDLAKTPLEDDEDEDEDEDDDDEDEDDDDDDLEDDDLDDEDEGDDLEDDDLEDDDDEDDDEIEDDDDPKPLRVKTRT